MTLEPIYIKSPESAASLLVIYTGGTLGMIYDEEAKILKPFNFENILSNIPEIRHLRANLTIIPFAQPIDSSNMKPENWITLARIIEKYYSAHDGFVIIHGTDTMAYSASALSFLLDNLQKPVIFTGSQLPIGAARTDARENIITSLEIAAAKRKGKAIIQDVCIFFNNFLVKGNRSKKVESTHFDAFESPNYAPLAEVGINIDYDFSVIEGDFSDEALKIYTQLDNRIAILKLFPGITQTTVEAILNIPDLKGLVLETYGSGNAPLHSWFIESLQGAINKGLIILNISQCLKGFVHQGRYETSRQMKEMGVIGGSDMTTEAAIAKLMFLFGNYTDTEEIKNLLQKPLRGELTLS